DVRRHRCVMIKDHRVLGTALAHGAQAVDVFEHVRQRYMRIDHDRDATLFLALDLATAGVQVADHVTDVIFRRHHLDLHHRLEQLRGGLLGGYAEAGERGDFDREYRGVDVVEGAVEQGRLDAQHRQAREPTRGENAFYALLDAREVFLRNG